MEMWVLHCPPEAPSAIELHCPYLTAGLLLLPSLLSLPDSLPLFLIHLSKAHFPNKLLVLGSAPGRDESLKWLGPSCPQPVSTSARVGQSDFYCHSRTSLPSFHCTLRQGVSTTPMVKGRQKKTVIRVMQAGWRSTEVDWETAGRPQALLESFLEVLSVLIISHC